MTSPRAFLACLALSFPLAVTGQTLPGGPPSDATRLAPGDASFALVRETTGLFESLPGFWVKRLGVGGQSVPFRFRGSEWNQSVALLNGMDLADPWTGIADPDAVPDAWTDSIAVYPSVNPFGLNAAGAVIDLASARDLPARALTRIVYDKDADGYERTRFSFSRSVSGRAVVLAGADMQKGGGEGSPVPADGRDVRALLRVRLPGAWRLEGLWSGSRMDRGLPFPAKVPPPAEWSAPLAGFDRSLLRRGLTAAGGFLGTRLALFQTLGEYRMAGKPLARAGRTSLLLSQSWDRILPLAWGGETRFESLEPDGRGREKRTTGRAFVSSAWDPFRRTRVSAQADIRRSSDGRWRWGGSGLAAWTPDSAWTVHASASSGLRDPSLGETSGFWFFPFPALTPEEWSAGASAAPDSSAGSLRPERSLSVEAGLSVRPGPAAAAGLSVYRRSVRDFIVRPAGRFVNRGERIFMGAEGSLRLGPWHALSAEASLNWMRAETGDGGRLYDRPTVWGRAAVTWTASWFGGDLKPGISAAFSSWGGFWAMAGPSDVFTGLPVPEGRTLDVCASARVMERAFVYFTMGNALAGGAVSVPGHPLPGRLTRFGLSWDLFD
jgi:hypothetical protein